MIIVETGDLIKNNNKILVIIILAFQPHLHIIILSSSEKTKKS